MRQVSQKSGATIKVPETRAELDALNMRRSELRDQLRSLEERRTQLSAQRQVTEPSQRGTMDQRIQAIDERIPRVEREILQLDEVIANNVGRLASVEPPIPIPPPGSAFESQIAVIPDQSLPASLTRDVAGLMLLEAAGFVIIGFVAWRYTLRWLEKRLLGKGTNAGDVVRLQQSVDSIAVEVERISENQRYVTKLLGEKVPELGAGEAKK